MNVDMDRVLVDFEGKPIKQSDKDMTLGLACAGALGNPLDEDTKAGPEKAVARWKLALRCYSGGVVELTPEEASEIRARLAKVYTTIICGQAASMLE